MTGSTDDLKKLATCRKLFNLKKKYAHKIQEIESDWQRSFQTIWKTEDSGTGDLPDSIVDAVDYGMDDMSFKEFCARMDMEYERYTESEVVES